MLPPPAATNPNTPIAFARSPGSTNSDTIIDSATADATAPPKPCTVRAPISIPFDEARPQISDATVNRAMPPMNSRR